MSEWRLEYEAAVGTRVAKRFFGVHAYPLWWVEDTREWMRSDQVHGRYSCSNTCHVRSVKAFKRHLRKHPELSAAEEVVLTSRWQGFDVYAKLDTKGAEGKRDEA